MTTIFSTTFIEGTLRVYENDRLMIEQPYNPDTALPWQSEEEALLWWESVKVAYGPPVVLEILEESIRT